MEFGEIEASLQALENAIRERGGYPRDLFNRFHTDYEYTRRIAQAMMRKGPVGHIELRLARAVLGRNIFTAADWVSFYDVTFTKKQYSNASKFPWNGDILASTCPLCGRTVRDCHFAFLGLDRLNNDLLTILKFQELHPAMAQPQFASHASRSLEKFVKETTMSPRWYLLHTNIVPMSENKTFKEQKVMLTAEYEVPSAVTEVAKDLLVSIKTGVYANPSRFGRCTDVDSFGGRVTVGSFDADGPDFSYPDDDVRFNNVGVTASRKLNT
ncbi:MAG: hypothetical protein NTW06_00585 [Candidatus Falkowbacteria bacterium]|nr:hypothetical protein [Candidatus Falkowbacteria bacterium]